MKRLVLIVVAVFCGIPAWGSISNPTPTLGCTAATTSCTLGGTPQFGDMEISCATRSSNTAPGTPSGYTVIASGGANTYSMKCAARFLNGTETATGTFTNASLVAATVWRGVLIASAINTGATPGLGNASSTTQTYCGTNGGTGCTQSLTFTQGDGTSWLLAFGACKACTAGNVAPSTLTLNAGVSSTNLAVSDSTAGVSAFTTKTVTVTTTGAVRSQVIELVAAPAFASALGYLANSSFHGNTGDLEGCSGSCILDLPIPSTLSGNFLRVWFAWQYASTAPTVANIYCNSDTGHATWTFTQAQHIVDTGDTVDVYDYYMANAPSGCTAVHVDADTAVWTSAAGLVQQLYNVPNAAPDASVGQTTTVPNMTAGAIAPTQTGDIILDACTTATMDTPSTNIYDSSGIVSLYPDNGHGTYASAFVYPGSGSTTFYHRMQGATGNAVCTSMAVKASAGAGTAPSGVYIVSSSNVNISAGATQKLQAGILGSNNAFVLMSDSEMTANTKQWTGLSDTQGNSYSQYQPIDSNGGYPNWAVNCASTAGNNYITLTGASGSVRANYWFLEIAGLDHSSYSACYDSSASAVAQQSSVTSPTNMPSITPSTSGGIILASSEMGTGAFPMSVDAPSGAQFYVATYTGQGDLSGMGLGNMMGWVLNSSTAAKSWGWTNDSTATQFNATAIALKVASGGPAPTAPTLLLTGAGQ